MGRLKRDHSGWSTSGKWLKYQQPTIKEKTPSGRTKKDTNKWCRGKVGTEHAWHRYQRRHYNWDLDKYISPYIEIKCVECRKEKYIKTARAATYPLHLWIEDKGEGYLPIQVRVNGKFLPIDYEQYQRGKYWCNDCGYWH